MWWVFPVIRGRYLFSPNALVCSTFTANLKKESNYGSLDRQLFETLTKIKYRGNNVKEK
jgi:hypothetical protein